ncbi:MAG: DUF1624 domain-containing protein [Candidatus Aenigmarchaeota archaeon]|nr:DUF1624 domain-containing protein [Candidatus Aenigmarchaeota archaeon]
MKFKRFYEIDLLRGIAIVLMITFHLFYDLKFFGIYNPGESFAFWWFFPRFIAFLFIFLVGVSLTLSYSRIRKWPENKKIKKYFLRGLNIFSWGLLITTVTYIFLPKEFIIFGILHFIGLSIILAYPLIRYKYPNIILGTSLIGLGTFLGGVYVSFPWLLWLGLIPRSFYTLDYFPLIPWFGVVLLGIFFGNTFYPNGKRIFRIKEIKNPAINFICALGRNSLLIYLIHQPILILIINLLM